MSVIFSHSFKSHILNVCRYYHHHQHHHHQHHRICVLKPISMIPIRRLSSSTKKNPLEDHAVKHWYDLMKPHTPAFPVHGNDIEVLHYPSQFFEALQSEIYHARRRISIASLYLGNGHLEQRLVDSLMDYCRRPTEPSCEDSLQYGDIDDSHNCVNQKSNPVVNLLLDYNRGQRGTVNSVSMLKPLLDRFPEQACLNLYHTPDLRGFLRRMLPERINEVIGVQHIKAYVFDDTLLLSGANLSHDYFTNRQDRYMLLHSMPELAKFFHDLIDLISALSFTAKSLAPKAVTTGESTRVAYKSEVKTKTNESIQLIPPPSPVPNPINRPDEFKTYAGDQVRRLLSDCKPSTFSSESDTLVFPLLQMGPFDVRHDETVTKLILSSAYTDGDASETSCSVSDDENDVQPGDPPTRPGSLHGNPPKTEAERHIAANMRRQRKREVRQHARIYVTSGYFNFTKDYMKSLLNTKRGTLISILTASPEANGFFGAAGVAGYIPYVYTELERRFLNFVSNENRQEDVAVLEFVRMGWTFHAKGLWYALPGDQLPSLSFIGSPNFGHRSVNRDIEAQVALATGNASLRRRLGNEWTHLYRDAKEVGIEELTLPERAGPRFVPPITNTINSFF